MTTIEHELNKILKDSCPVKNIKKILDETSKEDLNPDIMLESIEVLRMHEDEIRRIRQSLELAYQTRVVQRYLEKKNKE
jgi:hypothetical protein